MTQDVIFQAFEWYIKYEDKFWNKLENELPYLKSLGITTIWLPPAYKGYKGQNDSGYGVYDLYDLGEFNQKGSVSTKYGTKDEYLSLVRKIKDLDMKLIVDVVLNHRVGADYTEAFLAHEVDASNRTQILNTYEIEGWTGFDFKGRNNTYSNFKMNKEHFKAVDFDAKSQKTSIFLIDGKTWDEHVDSELSNYDYLLGADVDTNHPKVQEELLTWLDWYLELTEFDGVRLDAIKHIDAKFFKKGLEVVRQKNRDVYVVGEYWSGDLKVLHNYLMDVDFSMQLFDVPLHHALESASKYEQYDLRSLFNGTLTSTNPDFSVTFVDNHDTQIGQSLESWIEDWFKPHAYALILLRNLGTPCVFYGDLYGSDEGQASLVLELPVLIQLRKSHRNGTFYDYLDEPNLVGWCYTGNEDGEGLVTVLNTGPHALKRMFVGRRNANAHYVDCLNDNTEVLIDEDGIGYFPVEEKKLAIFIRKDS